MNMFHQVPSPTSHFVTPDNATLCRNIKIPIEEWQTVVTDKTNFKINCGVAPICI
jgi:hypothetical protein